MVATLDYLAIHHTAGEPVVAGHKRSAVQKDTAVETVAHMPAEREAEVPAHMPAESQGVERAAGQVVGMPTPLDRMT